MLLLNRGKVYMKIILLFCSDYSVARFCTARKEFPPLGLLYLAAACQSRGIDVELYDLADLGEGKIPSGDIIGLSINTSYVYPTFHRRIDEIRCKCKILVAGGQHATIYPEETCLELMLDYVLVGEGEYSLPTLIKRCYESNFSTAICDIPDVYSRGNAHFAQYTEDHRIKDLDILPFPARHLLPREEILLEKRIPNHNILSTNIITSRGCPYNCQFCGNVYKGFAFRSAKNVKMEIQTLLNEYPQLQRLLFLDDNLFFNRNHAIDIISIMKESNLLWTCNARVDGYTQDILPFADSSGCVEIKYGIESGSQKILNSMKKGITISDIERTLKKTVEHGIGTKCFLMFGFPGDCIETACCTIEFLERNRSYIGRVNLFSFSPVPHSPIYKTGICQNYSWEKYKIYHQLQHWWGTEKEYQEVKEGYRLLQKYINENFSEDKNGESVGC